MEVSKYLLLCRWRSFRSVNCVYRASAVIASRGEHRLHHLLTNTRILEIRKRLR
jgi:hypothetical protein